MDFDLELSFILPAKPTRVMQLLTDAALIRQWSGGEAILENKPGGQFEMFDGWAKGEVLKTTPNELSYTWKTGDWDEDAKPSIVNYSLKTDEAGCKVIVKHTGFPNEDEMNGHKSGWADYFFTPMEDYIMVMDRD